MTTMGAAASTEPGQEAVSVTPTADGSSAAAVSWTVADLVDRLCELDGSVAGVWVFDHGMSELRSLTDDRRRRLARDVRELLLAGAAAAQDDRRWTPIVERDQPVFVIESARPIVIPGTLGAELRLARSRLDEIERTRRREQMSVAAELQWSVLPVRADHTDRWAIGACLEPAYEVAGDLFDHAHADGSLWVNALDGMGHGLDATLLGVIALTALRNARRRGDSLTEQFATANRSVFGRSSGDAFVTAVGCRFDHDGSVEIVNAGHAPTRAVHGGAAHRLDLAPLLPLGVDPKAAYTSVRLSADEVADGLVLASDGLESGLGLPATGAGDRLDRMVAAAWHDAPLVTVHRLVDEVLGNGSELRDDLTLVAVRSLGDRRTR